MRPQHLFNEGLEIAMASPVQLGVRLRGQKAVKDQDDNLIGLLHKAANFTGEEKGEHAALEFVTHSFLLEGFSQRLKHDFVVRDVVFVGRVREHDAYVQNPDAPHQLVPDGLVLVDAVAVEDAVREVVVELLDGARVVAAGDHELWGPELPLYNSIISSLCLTFDRWTSSMYILSSCIHWGWVLRQFEVRLLPSLT